MPENTKKELKLRLEELEKAEILCKTQQKELVRHESRLLDAMADPNVDMIPKHLWSNPDHKPSHTIMGALLEVASNMVKLDEIQERIASEKLMVRVAIQALGPDTKGDK